MTTPAENTLALLRARTLLREIAGDECLPGEYRARAIGVLRHYPDGSRIRAEIMRAKHGPGASDIFGTDDLNDVAIREEIDRNRWQDLPRSLQYRDFRRPEEEK